MGNNVDIVVRRPRILVRTHQKFVSTLGVIVLAVVIIRRWYPNAVGFVLALIVISLAVLISLVEVALALILVLLLVTKRIILA